MGFPHVQCPPRLACGGWFGGYGIKKNGKLYFKVGDYNRADYEKHGSKPFTYTGQKGKTYEMSYWEVPDDCLEDQEMLEQFVEKACEVSFTSKKV